MFKKHLQFAFVALAMLCLLTLGFYEAKADGSSNSQSIRSWGQIKALYRPQTTADKALQSTHQMAVKPGATPASMPSMCFLLNVPWMPQVAPGDWTNTKNCGQACCVMMGGYYNNGQMQPWVIRAENNWLGYPSYWLDNGNPNGTGQDKLKQLLRGFHNLNSAIYQGSSADEVVNQGAMGRPVIVGVRTHMSTTGYAHWMVFIGWDGTYMYFNDPGRSYLSNDWSAGHLRCTPSQFYASWSSFPNAPRIYMPVYR